MNSDKVLLEHWVDSILLLEASDSRITAGIHFESDKVAGLKIGVDVAGAVLERAKTDGAQ